MREAERGADRGGGGGGWGWGFAGPHIALPLIRVLGAAVAGCTLIRVGDRFAVFVVSSLKDRLAALLRRRQLSIGKAGAIGTVGEREDKSHKVGELLPIETLRSEEEFFCARAAFRGHVGIAAVPFEGLGTGQVLQRPVIDNVLAEAVGLKVPL